MCSGTMTKASICPFSLSPMVVTTLTSDLLNCDNREYTVPEDIMYGVMFSSSIFFSVPRCVFRFFIIRANRASEPTRFFCTSANDAHNPLDWPVWDMSKNLWARSLAGALIGGYGPTCMGAEACVAADDGVDGAVLAEFWAKSEVESSN